NRDRLALRLLPLTWVLTLPALFAAPGLDAGPRQLLIVAPVLHALAWQAIDRWWNRGPKPLTASLRATATVVALGALVIAQNLAIWRSEIVPSAREDSRVLEQSFVRWGRWLRAHASPHASVASETTGAI